VSTSRIRLVGVVGRSFVLNSVVVISWIGENLALYSPSQDLREHGTPAVAGVARGYASLYPSVELWNADTLADHFKLGGMGPVVVGTASQVADELQKWIDDADIDGFSRSMIGGRERTSEPDALARHR
jgi:alkanesulfonate monooxygenase SsuD/methylene tetrahydromethanopterin reductase-like flavin-dependent oxidoreductase (luciferase family)